MDRRVWVSITHQRAHIQGNHIVLGESLLLPRMFALTLSVVDLAILHRLELVHQFLLLLIHIEECLGCIDPQIGILAQFQKLLVR